MVRSKKVNRPSAAPPRPLSPIFFAVLFFLCSADQTFSFHLHGHNFRWGQFLLLVAVLFSALPRKGHGPWKIPGAGTAFLRTWGLFFGTYFVAALLTSTPGASLLKGSWGLFNLGLAFLLFELRREDPALARGFGWGIGAIAGLIWTQALLAYWAGCFQDTSYAFPSIPLILHPFGMDLVIGYGQPDFSFLVDHKIRPNAFYYEPSYAGCALGFALPLLLVERWRKPGWRGLFLPALVLGAVILTTSRSGLLSVLSSMTATAVYAGWSRRQELLRAVLRVLLLAFIALGVFLASSSARDYLGTLVGIKGSETIVRLGDPNSSEGGRIVSALRCLGHWKDHPLLGQGVQADPDTGRLEVHCMDTWLEIAVEAGTLGLLAFFFAVGTSIRRAFQEGTLDPPGVFLVGAGLTVHFIIDLNLTQTFPRLDYWLLFYFALYLLGKRRVGPR